MGVEHFVNNVDTTSLATETTLAAVLAAVDGLELSADTININLDEVETLITATNAAIAALEAANDISGDDIVTSVNLARTTLDATLVALQASNETHSDEEQTAIASLEAAVTAFKSAFDSRDLATETTLEDVKDVLQGTDFASEQTSILIKENQVNGSQRAGVLGTDGANIASPSNPLNVRESTNRTEIAALSFSETLGAAGSHQTVWADVSGTNWLDVSTNIGDTSAVTAVIEFTNADDPNTTPLGVDDVTRPLTTTIAGAALGGVSESSFGIPAQMTWCRITVTDLTGSQDIDISVYDHDFAPGGAQIPLASAITKDFRAPISQSTIRGEVSDDDGVGTGSYETVPLTASRSLKVADAPDELASGSSQMSGSLPSGAAPTFDPVGPIVAANVIDTGWINASQWDYQFFHAIFDCTGVKIFLMDAEDDQGNGSITTSFAFPTRTTTGFGSSDDVGAPLFNKYFRFVAYNDTGVSCNEWTYRSLGLHHAIGPVFQAIDSPIRDFFPAPIHIAINKGRQPDGDWESQKANGTAYSTTTPLAGGASVTSGVLDTNGWRSIDIFVETDVTGTITVEFYEDTDVPVVREVRTFLFNSADVARGSKLIPIDTMLDGCQVTYTNDATAQDNFLMQLGFLVQPSNTKTRLANALTTEDDALVTQGILQAKSGAGTYGEIKRGGAGVGLDTHITGHEVDTPIESMDDFETGQGVANSVTAVPITAPSIINPKAISIANMNNDTRLFFGKQGVTRLTGDVIFPASKEHFEYTAGEAIFVIADPGTAATASHGLTANTVDVNSGTLNPTNIFAQDATYTTFDNQGDYVEISGFDATSAKTLAEISNVTLKMRGKKNASPASQTVAFAEVKSGSTTAAGATSVTSASLAGGSEQLYVVGISRNALNSVTGVSGGSLAFESIIVNQANGGRHLDIWWAYGDATAGAITATFSTSENAHITVIRVTGAHPTTTVEASGATTGTGTTVTGPNLGKTALGLGVTFVSHEAASASPGSGYTERADLTVGTGSNTNSLATQTKAFVFTGSEAATMTLASSTEWVAASVRILPAATVDPVITITNDQGGTAATFTLTSTTDADFSQVITTDAPDYADIDALVAHIEATTLGAAAAQIDRVWIEYTETEADASVRFAYKWLGGNT